MKKIAIVILIFVFSSQLFASNTITDSQIKQFLNDWISAQNNGSFITYAGMYASNFSGVRRSGSQSFYFNHDEWLKDREKMFRKKIKVKMNHPEIQITATSVTVKFEQDWESGNYKDKGVKVLVLSLENKILKITKEEMLFSKIISDKSRRVSQSEDSIGATVSDNDNFKSKYTSISEKDCSKVTYSVLMDFTGAESGYECPSIKGWRLFKVYDRDSERSWLNIANKYGLWSTADQVRINPKYFFGYFPNIDYSPRVEWRVSKDNVPIALIFRVAVTDPNPKVIRADSWLSRLFVISLKGNEPRFCGTAETNEEARNIADKAANCNELLIKEKNIKWR